MPLGTNHIVAGLNPGDTASTTAFIPEIWSDEIIASYENSMVLKPLVRSLSMMGKKGDTVRIPKPVRKNANEKRAGVQVTLNAHTESELLVTVDQHYEYSVLLEDALDIQAKPSMRAFYTQDAGYALARQVDTAIAGEGANFTAQRQINAATGALEATAGAAGTADGNKFSDLALRQAIQILDENNVPGDGRVLVVTPDVRRIMLGDTTYTSADFVSGRPVENGLIGTLYGVDIYVTTNLPTVNTDEKGMLLMHSDAIVFAEQLGVRTQTQYKQEWLGDLLTADTIYGTSIYRPECGVRIMAGGY